MKLPHYTNKKGKTVRLYITDHAMERFTERYRLVRGAPVDSPLETLIEYFNASVRINPTDRVTLQRLKRHGTDSMFFRHNEFTFVVHNGCIVTVEISAKGKRRLNKLPNKERHENVHQPNLS